MTGAVRCGVVGLGEIGARVAACLARHGRTPIVYDVRRSAYHGLPEVAEHATSPALVAADSDVVMLAVGDADQARAVLTGADGLLTGDRPGLVVVLLTTMPVRDVHALAALCRQHDATLLDTDITDAPTGLALAVGGPDEAVRAIAPILDDVAASVVHCGPVGTATVIRLARTMIRHVTQSAVHEARSLATAAGISDEHLVQALTGGDTDPLRLLKAQTTADTATTERLDRVTDRARDDLAAVQDFAGDLGLEVPLTDITRAKVGEVYAGTVAAPPPRDRDVRGRAMMDRVYGPGFGARIPATGNSPLTEDIVTHLFADVWARGHLTVRDRRLLVLGITATLGRTDLLDVQLHGALANNEFTPAQLDEIPLLVSSYAGVGNATLCNAAVRTALTPATRLASAVTGA